MSRITAVVNKVTFNSKNKEVRKHTYIMNMCAQMNMFFFYLFVK